MALVVLIIGVARAGVKICLVTYQRKTATRDYEFLIHLVAARFLPDTTANVIVGLEPS